MDSTDAMDSIDAMDPMDSMDFMESMASVDSHQLLHETQTRFQIKFKTKSKTECKINADVRLQFCNLDAKHVYKTITFLQTAHKTDSMLLTSIWLHEQ